MKLIHPLFFTVLLSFFITIIYAQKTADIQQDQFDEWINLTTIRIIQLSEGRERVYSPKDFLKIIKNEWRIEEYLNEYEGI